MTTDQRRLARTSTPGIYKRGNSYVVVERDRRGKQIKRFAQTLPEARTVKAALRADIHRGEFRPNSPTPFVTYAQEWVETYGGRTSRGLKEQTRRDYRIALERAEFLEHFETKTLTEVTAADLTDYAGLLKKRNRKLTPRTVRNLLLPLRLCMATARDRNHIRFDPFAGVKVIDAMGSGTKEDEVRALDEQEVVALLHQFDLAAIRDGLTKYHLHRIATVRLLSVFLLQTGCRVGEALALAWEDFEDDLSHVHIKRRRYKGTIDAPKSRYGTRTIPISPQVRSALKSHRGGDGGTAPVFRTLDGNPMDYSTAYRAFRPVADAAGLAWAGFHTCRHTCASWLLRRQEEGGLGANPLQVKTWLGHHSAAFTMDRYGHMMPSDLPDPDGFDMLIGATHGATRPNEIERDQQPRKSRKIPAKQALR